MRGVDETSRSLFCYIDFEVRTLARHPLRQIRRGLTAARVSLEAEFEKLFAPEGSPRLRRKG